MDHTSDAGEVGGRECAAPRIVDVEWVRRRWAPRRLRLHYDDATTRELEPGEPLGGWPPAADGRHDRSVRSLPPIAEWQDAQPAPDEVVLSPVAGRRRLTEYGLAKARLEAEIAAALRGQARPPVAPRLGGRATARPPRRSPLARARTLAALAMTALVLVLAAVACAIAWSATSGSGRARGPAQARTTGAPPSRSASRRPGAASPARGAGSAARPSLSGPPLAAPGPASLPATPFLAGPGRSAAGMRAWCQSHLQAPGAGAGHGRAVTPACLAGYAARHSAP